MSQHSELFSKAQGVSQQIGLSAGCVGMRGAEGAAAGPLLN